MKIFEYAIVYNPSDVEKKEGVKAQILVDVTRVLAKDITQANILASRSIPESHLDRLDRLEVAVRPF